MRYRTLFTHLETKFNSAFPSGGWWHSVEGLWSELAVKRMSLRTLREAWALLGAFRVCYFLQPSSPSLPPRSCMISTLHVRGRLTVSSVINPSLNLL